jgi:uncharacterized protein
MNIAITGATGFIGKRLVETLLGDKHALRVLARTRRSSLPSGAQFFPWDAMEGAPPADALAGADAIVHLAGEPVAQRWTPEIKRRIRESRVGSTTRLVDAMARLPQRPATLVCASAIGYYGDRGDEILTEQSQAGSGFLTEVCVEWERAAGRAIELGLRVVNVRIGVVLGANGGALKQMLPPFKMGVGGRLGSGRQWMSWIHVDDLVRLFRHALVTPDLRGPVNGTGPTPVRNADFTSTLASVLRRPAVLPVPVFGIKLLFGEMSEILLASQRVEPAAAQRAGFRFDFPDLEPALRQLLA